jgi:hypothetical protein
MNFFKNITNQGAGAVNQQAVDSFADALRAQLMTAANGSIDGRTIGLNLGNKQRFASDVEDLVGTIKKSYASYNNQLVKFQQTKELNQRLASSYKSNLQVMVDVSKLLASYTHLFEVLQKEMKKMSELIGANTDLTDLSYVSGLTQEQMQQLQNALTEQASSLTSIYNKYGMSAEAAAVTKVLEDVRGVSTTASSINTQRGGRNATRCGRKSVRCSRHSKQSNQ